MQTNTQRQNAVLGRDMSAWGRIIKPLTETSGKIDMSTPLTEVIVSRMHLRVKNNTPTTHIFPDKISPKEPIGTIIETAQGGGNLEKH